MSKKKFTIEDRFRDTTDNLGFIETNTSFAGYKNFRDCMKKNKDKESPATFCVQLYHKELRNL